MADNDYRPLIIGR